MILYDLTYLIIFYKLPVTRILSHTYLVRLRMYDFIRGMRLAIWAFKYVVVLHLSISTMNSARL